MAVIAGLALVLTACERVPVKNPPPGGGPVVTDTFRLGPFDLEAGEDVETTLPAPRPDGAFGMVGMRFRVVDDQGNDMSMMQGVHLHHIVMQNTTDVDRLCTGRKERFAGSGGEYTPIDLPDPYAYLVEANDQWRAQFHLMNMGPNSTDRTLYIEYDLDYQPAATPDNVRPVMPLYMDTTGCGNSQYAVPGDGGPGSVHVNEASWTAPRDGIAVWTGSHMHRGGIRGQLIGPSGSWCDSDAEYNAMGHLTGISSCQLHHQLKAGEDYTVRIEYENDEPIPDAMGLNFTYVWWGTQ